MADNSTETTLPSNQEKTSYVNPFLKIVGDTHEHVLDDDATYLPVVNMVPPTDNSHGINSLILEVICSAILCTEYREVPFPGQEMTVLLIDTDHKLKVDDFAVELQTIVSGVAMDHFLSLDKKLRPKLRINSTEQWHIVKRSLDRLQILEVFSPESLDLTLASLHRLCRINYNVNFVVINSINTFYQEVYQDTGVYASSYLRKLLSTLIDSRATALHQSSRDRQLYCMYTQHQLFNSEDRFYNQITGKDKIYPMKNPMFLEKTKSISENDNNENEIEDTCNDKDKDTLDKKKNIKKKKDNYSLTYKDVIIKKAY